MTWLFDSRTSNHMTPKVENLFDAQEYSCNRSITIGNGLTLPISHVGTAKINLDNDIIPLRNTKCSF